MIDILKNNINTLNLIIAHYLVERGMAVSQYQAPIFGVNPGHDEERISAPGNGILCLEGIFDEFLFTGEKGMAKASIQSQGRDGSTYSDDDDDDSDDGSDGELDADGKKRKRSRTQHRHMTEEQKVERR